VGRWWGDPYQVLSGHFHGEHNGHLWGCRIAVFVASQPKVLRLPCRGTPGISRTLKSSQEDQISIRGRENHRILLVRPCSEFSCLHRAPPSTRAPGRGLPYAAGQLLRGCWRLPPTLSSALRFWSNSYRLKNGIVNQVSYACSYIPCWTRPGDLYAALMNSFPNQPVTIFQGRPAAWQIIGCIGKHLLFSEQRQRRGLGREVHKTGLPLERTHSYQNAHQDVSLNCLVTPQATRSNSSRLHSHLLPRKPSGSTSPQTQGSGNSFAKGPPAPTSFMSSNWLFSARIAIGSHEFLTIPLLHKGVNNSPKDMVTSPDEAFSEVG